MTPLSEVRAPESRPDNEFSIAKRREKPRRTHEFRVGRIVTAAFVVVLGACGNGGDAESSPAAFVAAEHQDVESVVASVRDVESAIAIMGMGNAPGGGDQSAMVSFDSVLVDAQTSFDRMSRALSGAAKPSGFDTDDLKMRSATGELMIATRSLRAYLKDRRPSEVTDFHTHWDAGCAWWNQGVAPIWQAAGVTVPTVTGLMSESTP